MSQEPPNSSAENLLNNNDNLSNSVDNSYMNPVGPDSIPGSPPPTYQHVLDESQPTSDRTPTRSHLRRTSYDSISQCSNAEQSTPTRSSFIRRANTISTDDSSYRYEESDKYAERTLYEDYEKEIEGSEADLLSNVAASSEMSLWQDYQEPSTSYDASSRQLDEDSVTTLTVSQIGDRDSDRDSALYRTIENFDDDISENSFTHIPDKNTHNKRTPVKKERIIKVANKTSKVMYAALAKELGLQCRMSDQCRCADCQGGYLRCGDGDGDTTDGGLGAGTPMFVSEAFGHGVAPACQII